MGPWTVKRLHKELTKYYTENLGHRLPSPPPNLTLIAKDGNVEESIKVGSEIPGYQIVAVF